MQQQEFDRINQFLENLNVQHQQGEFNLIYLGWGIRVIPNSDEASLNRYCGYQIIHLNSGHTWSIESHSATDDNLILYAKDIINTIPVNSCSRCKYFSVFTTGNNRDEPLESEPCCNYPHRDVQKTFYEEISEEGEQAYIAIASECPGFEFCNWDAVEQTRLDAEYQEYLSEPDLLNGH